MKLRQAGIYIGVLLLFASANAMAFTGARMMKKKTAAVDPCLSVVPIGTVCSGGAIYAGTFDGGTYMVTRSGCGEIPAGQIVGSGNSAYPSADFTPTCSGATDSLIKTWNNGTGNYYDIPGAETVAAAATKSSSSYRGNVNTAAVASETVTGNGGYHAAARYCDRLNYSGYTDWYLPSKSELTYMYCKSRTSGGATYPNEDPNCATYGYASGANVLPGYNTAGSGSNFYYSSTEFAANGAWFISFANGQSQNGWTKTNAYLVRCVRRF